MQTTSELYKELLANGAKKEVQVEIAGEIYGEDRLCSLFTTGSLFSSDTLCAGSAVARQIDLVLRDYDSIPRMAKVVPSYRLVLGEHASEWIQKGVFYIDTRVPDKTSGTLTIHGFDDMLKGSVIWEPDQTLVFPMTFRAAAQVIAASMGLELDNPDEIDDTQALVDYPANDYTKRNVLQFIAAAHAANFVITDLGKLRMVGINDIPAETSYLVTENGGAILFGGVRLKLSDTTSTTAGTGEKVFVGGKVSSTGAPPAFDPISKIIVKVDDENAYFAGDATGLTLEVTCPYANQTIADSILAKVKGFVYQPFTAEDAIVDQAIELGDGITVDGIYTILAQQEITFDGLMAGRVAAPGQQEVESEYPYQTKEQQVDLKIARNRSLISKTAEEIKLEVVKKLDEDEANTLISAAIGKIELSVSSKDGSTSFVLTDGEAEISAQTLNLTVPAVNITGKLTASQIDAEELHVNAANIDGTLTANQVQLTGSISFSDLNSSLQNTINSAGGLDESEVTTLITSTLVQAPTIKGGEFFDINEQGRLTLSDDSSRFAWLTFESVDGNREIFSVGGTDYGGTSDITIMTFAGQTIFQHYTNTDVITMANVEFSPVMLEYLADALADYLTVTAVFA